MPLEPLRFDSEFRRYIWGGRRLETVLGKNLPPGDDYAESWEIVDHGEDQSRVAFGAMRGRTLRDLVQDCGEELFGRDHPQAQFPLLFKFLDARQNLSIQVHPNDAQGAKLPKPDLGKTEAWVVMDAEQESVIYAGLKKGVAREDFTTHLTKGTVELAMHSFQPRAGDCIFIPAGTVHAIGKGLLIAEVQQASDTTFRLFDWNRKGADGKPRALHLQEGLDVCDYVRGPVFPQIPQPDGTVGEELLVRCDKFVLRRRSLEAATTVSCEGRFHILVIMSGEVEIKEDPAKRPLRMGETVLLPACCDSICLTPRVASILLDISLP